MKPGDLLMDRYGHIYRLLYASKEALLVVRLYMWPEGEELVRLDGPEPRTERLSKTDARHYDPAIREEMERIDKEYYQQSQAATKAMSERAAAEQEQLRAKLRPL